MKQYKLIVRCRINVGWPVTDDDLKALDCYHEPPVFYADSNYEAIEIVDVAYELFCGRETRVSLHRVCGVSACCITTTNRPRSI